MDTTHWENVLIEWVNCLNLCKPIQNIQDLKDAEFFNNIYKILRKTSEIEYDVLTFLFDVFGKHYTKCNFSDMSNVHMCDLSSTELIQITSLLLHYTCIYDRRNVLTTPLCTALDQKTQVGIRNFLEKVTTNVTGEELINIVSDCLEETHLNPSTPWLSGASSPLISMSPLQEILKTPVAKPGRLQMKDREISKLKSELEYERFEKQDLQEELKLQIEKNKKLDQMLNHKKVEISRLRSEVLSLESRTPPHYQDKDSREIQKALRGEIQSLEQYIHQCDEEQEVLQKEKDTAKEMVRKLESQVTLWQEKFFMTETSFQTISDKAREQEIQYNNLRIHCDELEALLEDLRMKPGNDTIDENYQGGLMGMTPSCEDLAHSVVDIQLRDVQKQNEDLKTVLKESQDASVMLQTEMEKLTKKLQETDQKCMILINDKEGLLLKVAKYEDDLQQVGLKLTNETKTNKNLNEQLSKKSLEIINLQNNFDALTDDNNKAKKELENSLLKIKEFSDNMLTMESQIGALKTNLTEVENANEELKTELYNSNELCKNLQLELTEINKELNEQLSQKTSEITNLQTNFNTLTDSNNKTTKQLENALNRSEELSQNVSTLETQNAILKTNLDEVVESKKELETKLLNSEEMCGTLQATELKLNKINEELNTQISLQLTEITDLQTNFSTLTDSNSKTKKELENALLQSEELSQNLTTLETQNAILKTNLDEVVESKKELETQLLNSEKMCGNLQATELKLNKINEELNTQISLQLTEITDLQTNLNTLTDSNSKTKKELENALLQREELSQNVSTLESQATVLKTNLDEVIESKKELVTKLLQNEEMCGNLQVTELKLTKVNEDLNNQIAHQATEISDLQTNLNTLTDSKNKTTEELENALLRSEDLSKTVSTLESENAILKTNIDEVVESKNELETKLLNSEQMCRHLQATELQLTTINAELNNQIASQSTEITDLQTNITTLTESNNNTKKELENSLVKIEELSKSMSTLQSQHVNVQTNLDDTEEANKEITKKLLNSEETCRNLQETELKLTKINDDLNIEISQKTNEYTNLQTSFNTLTDSNNKTRNELENMLLKNEELLNRVSTVDSQNAILKTNLNEVIETKNDLETKLRSSEEMCTNLQQSELKVTESNNELNNQILQKITEFTTLQTNFNTLADSNNKTIKELEHSVRKIEELSNNVENLDEELIKLNNKLQETEKLLLEKDVLIEQLSERLENSGKEQQVLMQDYETVKSELATEIKNIEDLKQNHASEIKEMSEITQQLEEQIIQLNETTKTTGNTIVESENTIQDLLLKLKTSEEIHDILEKDCELLKKEASEINKICEAKSADVNTLQEKISVLQEKDILNEKLIHDFTTEKEALIKKLDETNLASVTAQAESAKLKEDLLEKEKTFSEKEFEYVKIGNDLKTELTQMNSLIHSTNDSMHKKDSELTVLKEEKQKLLGTVESLTDEVAKLKTLREELTKSCLDYKECWQVEVEEVKKIQSNLKDINKHLEDEKTSYRERISLKDKQIFELENKITELTHQKDSLDKEIDDAKAAITTVEKHLQTDNKLIEEYKIKIKDLEAQILQVYTDFHSEAQTEIDIIKQLQQINEHACKLKVENTTLNEELSKASGDNIILTTKNNLLEENLLKVKSVLISANDELATIITIVKDRKKSTTDSTSHLQIALESSEELIIDSEKDIEIMHKYVDELKKYIEEFCNGENEYLDQIESLKEELDAALNKCSEIIQEKKEDKLESESQITDLTSNLHKIIEKYNKLEKEHGDATNEIMNLKQKLADCQNKISNNDDLEQEIISLKEQLIDREIEIEDFKNKNQARLDELTTKNQTLKEELGCFTEKLEKLENAQLDYCDEIKGKDNDIRVLKQTIINLESMIEQKDIEISKLKGQLDDLRKHYDLLTKQNESFNIILNGNNDQKLKDIQKRDDHYESLLNEHKSAFENLKTVNNKLMVDINVIKSELNAANSKIQIMNKDKHAMENSIKEKNKLIDEFNAMQIISINHEQTITELKAELEDTYETITKLKDSKEQLEVQLELSRKETKKVKRLRDDLYESQTKLMKETENNISRAHESAVEVKNDLIRRIEGLENEKQAERENRKRIENEMHKVREAYGNVISANSTLELENNRLRNVVKEKSSEIADLIHIKDAYEKLLEENNKLTTDIDTFKYKRLREKEELKDLIRKEREDADKRQSDKIKEVKFEYEGKLEKMKEKMLKLYRDEVSKEMMKTKVSQQKQIEELKVQLMDSEQKIHILEMERDLLRDREDQRSYRSSRDSVRSSTRASEAQPSRFSTISLKSSGRDNAVAPLNRRVKSTTTIGYGKNVSTVDGRLRGTADSAASSVTGLPASLGKNLEMEDEDGDMFNNKYLSDLKEGRGFLTGRESTVSRVSTLAMRNSMVPPHLKSSYPAETQFVSPSRFKEDDIKTGNVNMDDSLSKLLPGDKNEKRQRKDFGTTSYKKPGPPTPSKNGGRPSLQGNEVHPLRDHNEKSSPNKKVTPGRLKALFMGKNASSLRDNSENVSTPTRSKRRSIFRKPK